MEGKGKGQQKHPSTKSCVPLWRGRENLRGEADLWGGQLGQTADQITVENAGRICSK